MAARQLILQKKIPFEVLTETDEPTEETRRALVAAEAKELGIIPDDVPEFDNTQDLKFFWITNMYKLKPEPQFKKIIANLNGYTLS